jgi:hypothetical protein
MKTPDYSAYIKKSFELTKKYKWLWIYGALVGAGSGTSFNSNLSRTFNNIKTEQNPQNILKDIPKDAANVLGTYTTELKDWFFSIPPPKWLLFTLLMVLLIIIGITIILIVHNWARGALIKGVEMAEKEKEVNLVNTSPYGFKYLKNLIMLSLRLFFIGLILMVLVPLLWTLVFLIIKNVLIFEILWIITGVLLLFVIAFICLIMLTLINIFAERLIVIHNMDLPSAWRKAIVMSKKSILPSVLMGIVNKFIGFAVGLGSLIILGIVIGIPAYLAVKSYSTNPTFSIILVTITAMSFLIFIFISTIISSALTTFNYSNWNQLFNDYFKNNPS